MATQRHFGSIPGVLVGKVFANRQELHDAKVHRPIQAGISGSKYEGSDSIVLKGYRESVMVYQLSRPSLCACWKENQVRGLP